MREHDPMSNEAANPVSLVPGRSCGECSLCCKLLRIEAFNKPVGVWCAHCAPGRGGCTVYETRPAECRNFYCAWLTSAALGPEWRPNKCKMFLRSEGHLLAIHVDPSDPGAWRREPFYARIKAFATKAVGTGQQVAVYVKDRVTVVLPNKELDVGTMKPGDQLVVRELVNARGGRDWTAFIEAGTGR
jgi:hypothetical protein